MHVAQLGPYDGLVQERCNSIALGLVQERRNSIANALESRLSCTNPSIYGSVLEVLVMPWPWHLEVTLAKY